MRSGQLGFQGSANPVCLGTGPREGAIKEEQAILWEADRASWATEQPVTATLASHLSLIPICDAHLPTATTDGRHLLFNATWSAGLDTQTRQFMQAHLVWHCVAGHLYMPREGDRRRWHLACDHEVNALLLLLGIPLPEDAVLFPACIGRPLHAVYDWLDHFPGLERERNLDLVPATWALHPADDTLLRGWRERALEAAMQYLGTPSLPGHVAAFLVTRQ